MQKAEVNTFLGARFL